MGNRIEQGNPWAPVITKVKGMLQQWGKLNPSMKGRNHIINIFVGGITFYLTKVQGMPKEIEDNLEKIIRTFMWENSSPRVNMGMLHEPIERGGRNLLDIRSRNEAIHLLDERLHETRCDKTHMGLPC